MLGLTVYALKFEKKNQKLKQVKCPSCGHGRICDVSIERRTKTSLTSANYEDIKGGIFIKCPKCGVSVVLTNE